MLEKTMLDKGEFSALQQLFVKPSVLLRHSYSLAKGCLFFLAGISLLVLTACAGGGGGSSGGNGGNVRLSPLEVNLTFAPIPGGFRIGNQSDFGDFVVLRITATSGANVEPEDVPIGEFVDGRFDFTGLLDLDWKFEVIGILSDGGEREVTIVFTWQENRDDHAGDGIRSGRDTDGDRRANSVDEDDDNDGINDTDGDDCPVGDIDWTSNSSTDKDNDGCQDADEDKDDDNDGLADTHAKEDQPNSDGVSCSLLVDCDGDTINDIDEVATKCVIIAADCDSDGIRDEVDACPVGVMNWTSSGANDGDGDGCRNDEDIDDDGDGLIEIATHQELNAVRYALSGNGSRSAANAVLDTTGCGGDGGITECSGYELVANISLAAYSSGDGWQPLGHDTDSATSRCQGAAFDGTFEGNGWTISDLSINRSNEDCVGLFGYIAADSEIRNLALRGDTVIGRGRVGGLVGDGQGARIVSSSIVMNEIIGTNFIGGLVGVGNSARIHSSSVSVAGVIGAGADIHSFRRLGGLVGWGDSAQIVSSSVVAGRVSGADRVAGLIGSSTSAHIYSSWVVVGELSVTSDNVGGLVGSGVLTQIYSSSVVVGEISGLNVLGGLVGVFISGKVAYSYVVSGSDTAMLVGEGSGQGAASYWDSETSGRNNGNHGTPQTTSALRMPMDYTGIYDTWDDDEDIFGDGAIDEPLAIWCDRDKSGSIDDGERDPNNRIWDFGGTNDYPAIRCTPISPTEWRSLWSVDGAGKLSFLGFLGG